MDILPTYYIILIARCDIRGVRDGVFDLSSELSLTSSMVAVEAYPYMGGAQVLDIGCGSGALSVYAATQGRAERVVAVDVDDRALQNTRENAEAIGCSDRVDICKSNLFEHAPEKLNVICANLPIRDELWGGASATSEVVRHFLEEYRAHLTEKGRAFLAWGSFGDTDPLYALLHEHYVSAEVKHADRSGFRYSVYTLLP